MADSIHADLRGSRFERVDLSGAQLRAVDLSSAMFRGARSAPGARDLAASAGCWA